LKRYTETRSTTASYDLAPGGWYDGLQQVSIAAAGNSNGLTTSFKNVTARHNFIPTVSALGFQYRNMAGYQTTASLPDPMTVLLGRNLSCNNETPFDAYYGPANRNVQHVEGKDDATSAFLFRELAAVSETPVFTTAQPTVCPNENITFALPLYCGRFPITYTWTLSGNLIFASGQTTAIGNSQVVRGTTDGSGQITVVATQQGMAPSAPLVYQVRVGSPEVQGTYTAQYSSPRPILTDNQVPEGRINITVTSSVADCNFYVSSTDFSIIKTGPKSAYFDMGPYGNYQRQGVTVRIEPTSGCFASKNAVFRRPSAYRYAYSPNPASDELTVTAIETDQPATGPASTTAPAFEAELYNNHGKKVKAEKSEKGKAKINVSDLPDGLYNLRAGKGKEAISEHIMVSH
jgi:hypothetical protein